MRIGVAGLGFMGSTHLRAWRGVAGAQVVAIAEGDPVKRSGDLREVGGNLDIPTEKHDFSRMRCYETLEGLLGDDQVDAVDLCLPTYAHTEATIAALRAGKHVLIEKPIALDGDAADGMIAEAERAGRILMCGQVLRFLPEYAGLAAAMKQAGTCRSAIFRRRCAAPAWGPWLRDRSRSGGGVFDLLIHDVDYAISQFGMPHHMTVTGHEDLAGGIDIVTATFYYPGRAPVIVTGGWHHVKAYPFVMEYTVVCDKATFEYSSAKKEATVYSCTGDASPLQMPAGDPFEAELRYFHECITTGRQPELCPPQQSAAAVRLTALIRDSRNNNGETIACEL